jgi:hypothetical protein
MPELLAVGGKCFEQELRCGCASVYKNTVTGLNMTYCFYSGNVWKGMIHSVKFEVER